MLKKHGADFVLSVATDYGRDIMDGSGAEIISGRLDCRDIVRFIREEGIETVIDATHPYAEAAAENIEKACGLTGAELIVISRESGRFDGGIYVDDAKAAAKAAADMRGKIFVSTGAKEIDAFTGIIPERLRVRVLPVSENISKIKSLGITDIIAEQGPFTERQNINMMRGCAVLVTKESGKNGGFCEKISAAKKLGMKIIIIKRPRKKQGITIEEFEKNYDIYIGKRTGGH